MTGGSSNESFAREAGGNIREELMASADYTMKIKQS
jgi:hypothetical protein